MSGGSLYLDQNPIWWVLLRYRNHTSKEAEAIAADKPSGRVIQFKRGGFGLLQ